MRISVYEEISVASVSRSFSEGGCEMAYLWRRDLLGAWISMRAAGTTRVVAPVLQTGVVLTGNAVECYAVPRGSRLSAYYGSARPHSHLLRRSSSEKSRGRAKLSLSQLSVDVLSESEVRVYGAVDAEVDLVLSGISLS